MAETRLRRLTSWISTVPASSSRRVSNWIATVSGNSRLSFSMGIGAGFASTVNFSFDIAKNIAQPLLSTVSGNVFTGVNYTLTGITFIATTWITKNKFDKNHAHIVELRQKASALRPKLVAIRHSNQQAQQIRTVILTIAEQRDHHLGTHLVQEIDASLDLSHRPVDAKELPAGPAWKSTRYVFASTVGASFASGVHYCLQLGANAFSWVGTVPMALNIVATGISYINSTRLANKKLLLDLDQITQHGGTVVTAKRKVIEAYQELRSTAAIRKVLESKVNKLEKKHDNGDLALISAARSQFTGHGDHVIDINTPPSLDLFQEPSKCKEAGTTISKLTKSIFSGCSFGLGVYYCGNLGVTLASWATPVGAVVTTVQYLNYGITALHGLVVAKVEFNGIEASPYRINGFVEAVNLLHDQLNQLDIASEYEAAAWNRLEDKVHRILLDERSEQYLNEGERERLDSLIHNGLQTEEDADIGRGLEHKADEEAPAHKVRFLPTPDIEGISLEPLLPKNVTSSPKAASTPLVTLHLNGERNRNQVQPSAESLLLLRNYKN